MDKIPNSKTKLNEKLEKNFIFVKNEKTENPPINNITNSNYLLKDFSPVAQISTDTLLEKVNLIISINSLEVINIYYGRQKSKKKFRFL